MFQTKRFSLPRRRRAGVTLIEVMIALAVLVFGLGGLAELQATTMRHDGEQRLKAAAQLYAFQKGEELRAISYARLLPQLQSGKLTVPATGAATLNLTGKNIPTLPSPQAGRNPKNERWHADLEKITGTPNSIRIHSVVEWGPVAAPRTAEYMAYVFE